MEMKLQPQRSFDMTDLDTVALSCYNANLSYFILPFLDRQYLRFLMVLFEAKKGEKYRLLLIKVTLTDF